MIADLEDHQLLRLLVGNHRAEQILGRSLCAILDADDEELAQIGLPAPLRRRLQVVAEVARRHQPVSTRAAPVTHARPALAFFRFLRSRPSEAAAVLLLDAQLVAIGVKQIAVGGTATVSISPREIFEQAITHRAASVIVGHNHPSGDPTPSPEDVELTRRAVLVGQALGVELLDHLVVAKRAYFSFREAGML